MGFDLYDAGPIFPINECIGILGKIPIPLPQATPQMVPLAVPSVPQGDIGTEYSQNILQQSQREAHPEPQIPQLDRASVDGPAGVKQFVQPHNTMVPGLNSMSTQEYIQPPQFEEKWPHNVNWRKRGRPRGGGSGSGGWSKVRRFY